MYGIMRVSLVGLVQLACVLSFLKRWKYYSVGLVLRIIWHPLWDSVGGSWVGSIVWVRAVFQIRDGSLFNDVTKTGS